MPREYPRAEHLRRILLLQPYLAYLLERQKHTDEGVRAVHRALQATRKRNRRDVAETLKKELKLRAISREELPVIAQTLETVARHRRKVHTFAYHFLEHARYNKNRQGIPAILRGISAIAERHDPEFVAFYTSKWNLDRFAESMPHLVELSRLGADPGRLLKDVDGHIWDYKGGVEDVHHPALMRHALLARQEGRTWNPAELIKHALAANREIKDISETLRLQREIIEQTKGKFLPTKKLTLDYWRAKH
jgi:hypothetical protein